MSQSTEGNSHHPEEAEEVVRILQIMKLPKTHLITYVPPITRQAMHFSGIQFYNVPTLKQPVPTHFITETGLVAGIVMVISAMEVENNGNFVTFWE